MRRERGVLSCGTKGRIRGSGRRCCNSRTGQTKNPSSNAATTVDVPIGWNPNTKKEPTGLFFTACGRPCSFDSSYGFSDFHLFLTFLQIGTCNNDDRCLRQKQGGVVGAAASRMQAPLKARSRRWEPQPVALSNSPLGCCLPCCAGSCCSIPVRVKKKSLEQCSNHGRRSYWLEPEH